MNILNAVVLGILQGVAEFLPISSSGHLQISKTLLGIQDVPLVFDILLHVSTMLVVILVFRKRIISVLISLKKLFSKNKSEKEKENIKLSGSIILASFFTAGIGLSFSSFEFSNKFVSVFFIITACLLIMSKFIKSNLTYKTMTWKTGVLTGIAQGFGVLPGISRSGITITASVFSGLSREKAGEYSFLLSIPAILGALLLDIKDLGDLYTQISLLPIIFGMLSSFLVGWVSLKLLLKMLKSDKLYYFAFYLIPVGIIGLILA